MEPSSYVLVTIMHESRCKRARSFVIDRIFFRDNLDPNNGDLRQTCRECATAHSEVFIGPNSFREASNASEDYARYHRLKFVHREPHYTNVPLSRWVKPDEPRSLRPRGE